MRRLALALAAALLLAAPAAARPIDSGWCEAGRFLLKRDATTAEEVALLLPDLAPPPDGVWLMRFGEDYDGPGGLPFGWSQSWTHEDARRYCDRLHRMATQPQDGTYAFTVRDTDYEGCPEGAKPDFTNLTATRRLAWPGFFHLEPILAATPIPLTYTRVSQTVVRGQGRPPGVPEGTVTIAYEARATGRESFDLTGQVDLTIGRSRCIGRVAIGARRTAP